MVKVLRVSFEELLPLLDLSNNAIVLFDALFSTYQLDLDFVEEDQVVVGPTFDNIYHVTCDNGDRCEEYLVNVYYREGVICHVDYDMRFDILKSRRILNGGVSPVLSDGAEKIQCKLDTSKKDFGMLFIGGDKSAVGKSTTCLCLLASLLAGPSTGKDGASTHTDIMTFKPEDLAYIKPVTQCEADTTVTKFCNEVGIACIPIGPVVFYKGFTRSFLAAESEFTREEYLEQVRASVAALGLGKRLVLIDGVGYPSVGSICGLSNAEVCRALGERVVGEVERPLRSPPVLLVGKPGVGDAIDSYNLNERYFQSFGVRVLGALFNKLNNDPTDYYYVGNCRESIELYFRRKNQDRLVRAAGGGSSSLFDGSESKVYGLIPLFPPVSAMEQVGAGGAEMQALVAHFMQHADLRMLLRDLWLSHHFGDCVLGESGESGQQSYQVRRGQILSEVVANSNTTAGTSVSTPVAPPLPSGAGVSMDVDFGAGGGYLAPRPAAALHQQQQQARKRKSRDEINRAVEQKFGRTKGG